MGDNIKNSGGYEEDKYNAAQDACGAAGAEAGDSAGYGAANESNEAVYGENAALGSVKNDEGAAEEADAAGMSVNIFEGVEPAAVDYSVGAGARETVRPVTRAYNSGAAGMGANGSAGAAGYGGAAGMGANGSAGAAGYGGATGAVANGSAGAAGGVGSEGGPDAGSGAGFGGADNIYYNEKPKAAKKIRKPKPLSPAAKRAVAFVMAIILCGAAGFGGGAIAVNVLSPEQSSGVQNIKIDASDAESLNAASVIAKKVIPSVVGISTVSQTYTQTIFGLQQGTSQGVGTGIIVSEDGYILTNSHVINDGSSQSITVDLYDGKEYEGKVLWNDATLDLAIVKIDAENLTAAEFGDSDKVEIGDYAVAIGNPLGLDFERSVSQGIISGLERTITTSDGSNTTNTMEGLIQTDASINSGNSGGPLINSSGQVIGINTAKASSAEGLGFSIPINTALPIIDEIKQNGTYEQAYIGITGMDLSYVKSQYQTDFNAEEGIYIYQIYTNSPAAAAGLQEGDIITEFDGSAVKSMDELKKMLVKHRPGDTVKVKYERNKQNNVTDLILAASSQANQNTPENLQPSQNSQGQSGNSGEYYYGGLGDLFGMYN